ncbi:class II aldolase/adducin family protein [Niallia sp. 01092]|uniref:class II aldolase/adducin family protein n=1 Tax=unclassified Niallia TaxID=2837522 RepID=UPI003FD5ABA3
MYQILQQEVHAYALKAFRTGLMAGTSGNFSAFDRELGVIAITPSGVDYETIKIEDITILDLKGNCIKGKFPPSSEWQMHLAIYATMPEAAGVAHTHSPYATAFAVLNQQIPVVLIEMVLLGGEIPVAPFALPGTLELGEKVVATLKKNQTSACLLKNHGALTIGTTLEEAYMKSVYLEDSAKIYHFAKSAGEVHLVSERAIQEMKQKMAI